MAFTKRNSFSGGSNGVTISTGNSGGASGDAFASIGGSPSYTTTNATGLRAPMVASMPASSRLTWDSLTLADRTLYVRTHVYLTANPSLTTTIIDIDVTSKAGVRINTAGRALLVSRTGSTLATSTNALPTGQWVRIELQVTFGTTSSNGSGELRIYHSADSTSATESLPVSAVDFSTTVASSVSFYGFAGLSMDDLGASDVTWLGPNQLHASVAPATLTGAWSLPAPAISTGAGAAPPTVTGTWSVLDPEIVTAGGLVPTNPDRVESAWSLPVPSVAAFRNVTVEPATVTSSWQVLDPFANVPVNPGDKLTAAGQIEWNGVLLGSGTPYRMQQLDGWITDMPNLDSTNVAQPNRHGSYSGRKYSQERTVTLSGLIRTRREDMEQVVQALIAETPVFQDDTELPLAIRLLDVVYVGYGSVIRRSIPVDKNYRLGQAKLTLQWVLSDPLLLSRDLGNAVVSDGGTATLTNLGNAETFPTLRIPGPAVNPAVELQYGGVERLLEFNLTLTSGQTLIVDTYYGTTEVGGADVQETLSGSSTAVTDMVLGPGQNTLTYDGGGSAPQLTALWRHAYL